mmetsp:Transcript_71731/g.222461  ORF Transcript_71731/g.222461 Transcript_71731/m.222461 type:complete len:547 (+) Transcript_71731:120-1760(+)
MAADGKRFAFIFPMASGHINPSLPIARSLVDLGHEVHYLCREQMREAIEDTGSAFHSDVEWETELYTGREPDIFGAMECLRAEHGLDKESMFLGALKLMTTQAELMLPGVLRFLRKVAPNAIVFCPLMNLEAALAGRVLRIPSVALLTTAGLGSGEQFVKELFQKEGLVASEVERDLLSHGPHLAAVARLNAQHGLNLGPLSLAWLAPLGKMGALSFASATLVTTSEELQDNMTQELAAAYREEGVVATCVGPLLDRQGACRASVHRYQAEGAADGAAATHLAGGGGAADPLALLRAARAAGRRVVLVSMGTVITGDSPHAGWEGRMPGLDGQPHGITGRELCRAAWGGAFDAFGAESAEEGALILVALGPQQDALGDLAPPPNAVCVSNLPQVDLLKLGVDLFLTHGGQNSFMESLAHGTPVVVCPGFGDQVVNSQKAVDLGVGLKVDRPDPDEGEEAASAAEYRADVCRSLRGVLCDPAFGASAARCAAQLRAAGGVPRAVELVLAAAAATPATEHLAMAPAETKVVSEHGFQAPEKLVARAGA